MPDSLEQLDLLLVTVAKLRKIHSDGIHFQGLRYPDPVLAVYVGETESRPASSGGRELGTGRLEGLRQQGIDYTFMHRAGREPVRWPYGSVVIVRITKPATPDMNAALDRGR